MDKERLIETVASRTGFTKRDVRKCINSMLGIIGEQTKNGETVVLPDFGKFLVKTIPSRKTVRKGSDEVVIVPEHQKISFTPYKNIIIYSEKYES